ncbi:hypothetical protein WSS_A22078 [Rhodococcus opacus M213]|uniref:Uncharacterized protein n=1 Tax=Rhodococcus opacus M213 TaxID=1129896 RepID=K8XG40_RHOOP|nr:hypothetical protein [Rhodococcus opacus]EKT80508.1 hypothetical protein WSS_A22078 [Rhodococcus opacus M213]
MTQWGIVGVDHHQFVVGFRQANTLDGQQRGSLLEVGPGFATVYTGIAYGPVRVGVEVLESAPHAEAFPEWEVIEGNLTGLQAEPGPIVIQSRAVHLKSALV